VWKLDSPSVLFCCCRNCIYRIVLEYATIFQYVPDMFHLHLALLQGQICYTVREKVTLACTNVTLWYKISNESASCLPSPPMLLTTNLADLFPLVYHFRLLFTLSHAAILLVQYITLMKERSVQDRNHSAWQPITPQQMQICRICRCGQLTRDGSPVSGLYCVAELTNLYHKKKSCYEMMQKASALTDRSGILWIW
jgi:hypothetical protein